EARLRAQFLEHERMRKASPTLEGAERAIELPLPAVRLRQRARGLLVGGNERGEGAQALAVGGRLLDRPRECRERPPRRGAAHLVLCEQIANLVPEGARLARPALVIRRLADEVEPPRGARAGRVEEVAVALDRVRLREPRVAQARVELARLLLRQERGAFASAWQRPLLEAEDEHDLVATRPGAQEIDHVDAAGFRGASPDPGTRSACQGGQDLVGRQRAAKSAPALQLTDEPGERLEGAQVLPRALSYRWRVEPVRCTEHEAREVLHRVERRLSLAEELEGRERVAVAEPHRLLFRPVARLDGAAAQASLDPVDARTRSTRVGRTQEAVQLAAAAALPGEPKQREQCAPERWRF